MQIFWLTKASLSSAPDAARWLPGTRSSTDGISASFSLDSICPSGCGKIRHEQNYTNRQEQACGRKDNPSNMLERSLWRKTHTLNGPTIHSIHGGVAPRFHQHAIIAMQSNGRNEWATRYGVSVLHVASFRTNTGRTLSCGTKKLLQKANASVSSARAWPMYLNGVQS